MTVSLFSRVTAGCGLLTLALPVLVLGQTNYAPQGGEYAVTGGLLGDQVRGDVAVSASGGFLVWEDYFTDGDGSGISALRLDSSFSRTLSPFRVNGEGAFDQERPRVAALKDGGAVFVWQGGQRGAQRIYARFLTPGNTWASGDILVNSYLYSTQLTPTVATLANGEVVVVWASFNQSGNNTYQDVFAQRFSATGGKLGGEFRVNQFVNWNQRSPAVVALSSGGFVVAWVSEQQRFEESVDIYARLFDAEGNPVGAEFVVNTEPYLCAHPALAAPAEGGFVVAWSQRDAGDSTNSWDVVARRMVSAGAGDPVRFVNVLRYGDQLAPRVAVNGADYLVTWTSYGQDGSDEGVYGRYLSADAAPVSDEFRVNTTTVSKQIHPAVSADGQGRFLVTWSSYIGGTNSFDLFAQRFATVQQPLAPPDAPYVTVLSSNALSVTWPLLAGFNVAAYEVYANEALPPAATAVVTSNRWTATGLAPSSTHWYRLAYVLTDGRRSPLSGATTNTTYARTMYYGIPTDWMDFFFGEEWPAAGVDSDGDGVSNRDEFLAGTDPTDPNSVLRVQLANTSQGFFLAWQTEPGLIYQVQTSTSFGAWANVGEPRFAAGRQDWMYVGGGPTAFYRVVRLR